MKHFLSESAVWQTSSEFVSPEGKASFAEGQSGITISEAKNSNKSRMQIRDIKRMNHYKITPISPTELIYESFNPEPGKQMGVYNIAGNTIFSKFKVSETSLDGYEIIRREENICYAQSALYNNDRRINTWTAILIKCK